MTRDEVKNEIAKAIDEQFPENVDLDGDDLDTVDRTVSETTEQIAGAMDAAEEEDDEA